MRQDPDVILVGEIRDRETAEIAIQASLTGHLVFSTLHTNDAASAIARLVDIGAASYQIATAVKGVIAQRLVRRLCTVCAGAGCRDCGESGYRGRRAIAEILVASPEFERRVASGATPESIAEAARANGCTPLWEAGLALVRRGETSIDELRRVAAEPARRVTEPAVADPTALDGPTRIGWWSARAGAVSTTLRGQLTAAAATFGDGVQLLPIVNPASSEPVDAVVMLGAPAGMPASDDDVRPWRGARAQTPLIVALAPDGSAGEHVRLLAHGADVVLSANTHGRVVLATVLALLRWRAR